MIKRLTHHMVFTVFLLLAVVQVKGQDFPWSLQYITNMYTINPAYVGMWEQGGALLSTRVNWVGITGAPLAQQFSFHSPIKGQRSGLGMNLQRMNIGKEKRFTLSADYSYQLRFDMHNYFRFGLRAGILSLNNNLKDYDWYPDNIEDPESLSNVEMLNMTIVGIGMIFFGDKYYVSLSVPQRAINTFGIDQNLYSYMPELQTSYLSTGYAFTLKNTFVLRPNLLITSTPGRPLAFDASAILYLPGNLQGGISFRSNGAMCISGQYTFRNSLRIGYAAEYYIVPDISKYQMGSYEVFVGYDFKIGKRKNTSVHYF